MASGFGKGFFKDDLRLSDGFNSGFYKPTSVITNGLVLHYDISSIASYPGNGTTVVDLQGNSNATLVGGPTYSDGYLTFDGTNDYLLTSTSLAAKVTTDITTISMWAYPMDNGVLLTELGQATINTGWHDAQIERVSGTMKFGTWSGAFVGGSITSITSTIATSTNAWYNFTMVHDGSTLTAYVNGASAGTVTYSRSNPVENGNGLHYAIGAIDGTNMGDGTYANMRLGQFLVYNVALSADEILQNYTATKGRYGL